MKEKENYFPGLRKLAQQKSRLTKRQPSIDAETIAKMKALMWSPGINPDQVQTLLIVKVDA